MNSKETLRTIEKRAYNLSQKHGQFELFSGLVFTGIFSSLILSDFNIKMPLNLLIPIIPVYLAYLVINNFIIKPRMGVVKYGPVRRLKLKRLLIITLIIIVLQLAGLISLKLGFLNQHLNNDLLIASLLSFLFIFTPFALIAYYRDYWPAYLLAITSSFIWPETVLLSNYLDSASCIKYIFLSLGLFFIVLGMIRFIIFLKENPRIRNINQI